MTYPYYACKECGMLAKKACRHCSATVCETCMPGHEDKCGRPHHPKP